MILRVNEFSYDFDPTKNNQSPHEATHFSEKTWRRTMSFAPTSIFSLTRSVRSFFQNCRWAEGAHHEEVGSSQYLPPL